ncbi:unnamed protein product, partial [Prorocentrum cordatum]
EAADTARDEQSLNSVHDSDSEAPLSTLQGGCFKDGHNGAPASSGGAPVDDDIAAAAPPTAGAGEEESADPPAEGLGGTQLGARYVPACLGGELAESLEQIVGDAIAPHLPNAGDSAGSCGLPEGGHGQAEAEEYERRRKSGGRQLESQPQEISDEEIRQMEQKAEEEMKRMEEELAADEADAREAEAAALRLEEEQGRKAAAAKRIEEENSRWLQDRHKEWMQERQARMDASIATAEAALGVEGGGDLDVRMQEQAELARQQHLKDEQEKLERERNEQLQKKREEVVKRMEDMKRKKEEAQHNAAKRRKLAEERIQAAQANLTATQKVIEASQKLVEDGAVDAAGGSAPETDDVTRVVRRELDRSRSRSPHPLDITPQLGSKGGRDVDGSAGKGELTAAPPPKTKQELLAEIENEADLITRDIASGHNADEMTMEFAAQRLVKIFNSDALKRIQELRAKDPLWAEEERRRTGQTDKTMDDEFTEFWETMQGKDFYFDLDESISNPAAAKWRRAKQADQKLADDYKEAKGWPAKAKFRRDWMEGQFTLWAAETKYKRGEINEKAESKDGQYIPLARIAVEYGGGLTGLRAAINWCQSCILLGGEHVEYCPRAKHLNYLHVVHKLTDTYKKTME